MSISKFLEPTYEDNNGRFWTVDELLELVKDWEDPNPDPIITKFDDVFVVQDELLDYGAKIRFVDKFIRDTPHKEIVFGSSLSDVIPMQPMIVSSFFSGVAIQNIPRRNKSVEYKCGKSILNSLI